MDGDEFSDDEALLLLALLSGERSAAELASELEARAAERLPANERGH